MPVGIVFGDAVLRALIVMFFVALTASTALLGMLSLALVAGLIAVALIADYLFPVTGFLHADSENAFQRLRWQRRRAALADRIKHRDRTHLELLPDGVAGTAGRRHLGIQPIPLASIIGTLEPEKAVAFDDAFRPPSWSRGRWQLMWIACRRGQSLPPISVYRLDGRHFVIDGHHRVSVANSLDIASIDADVIELLPGGANFGPSHPPGAPTSKPLEQTSASKRSLGRSPSPLSVGTVRDKTRSRHGWRALPLFLGLALGLTLLSAEFAAVPGYVLILTACAFIGWGLGSPIHTGLKHHRQ